MKNKKIINIPNLLFIVIFLLLVFVMAGDSSVYAAGSDVDSGTYRGVPWRITSDNELIIGEKGKTKHMTETPEYVSDECWPWKEYSDSIKTVKVLGTVYAKGDCSNMFYDLSNCSTIDLENLRTDSVTSMYCMFGGCTSLKNIDVTGFDTDNVTDMAGMFCQCGSLESIDVSHFNTEKVECFGGMFSGCIKLTQLDLSGFDTGNAVYYNSDWDFDGFDEMLPDSIQRLALGSKSLFPADKGEAGGRFSYIAMTRYKTLDDVDTDGPSYETIGQYDGTEPGWYSFTTVKSITFTSKKDKVVKEEDGQLEHDTDDEEAEYYGTGIYYEYYTPEIHVGDELTVTYANGYQETYEYNYEEDDEEQGKYFFVCKENDKRLRNDCHIEWDEVQSFDHQFRAGSKYRYHLEWENQKSNSSEALIRPMEDKPVSIEFVPNNAEYVLHDIKRLGKREDRSKWDPYLVPDFQQGDKFIISMKNGKKRTYVKGKDDYSDDFYINGEENGETINLNSYNIGEYWNVKQTYEDPYEIGKSYSFRIEARVGSTVYSANDDLKVRIDPYGDSIIIDNVQYDYNETENQVIASCADRKSTSGKVNIRSRVVLPNGKEYPVQHITCFDFCRNMTSVIIPDTVKSITDYAFVSTGLKEITIPSSVEEIGSEDVGYNADIEESSGFPSNFRLVDGFVIHGYAGSAAEQYAKDNNITFQPITQPTRVTGVSVSPTTYKMKVGDYLGLTENIQPEIPSNNNVTWSSDKPSVAKVDANGEVTAVSAGKATITVRTEDGGYTAGCEVTVVNEIPVQSVSLDKTSLRMKIKTSQMLGAILTPNNASDKSVTWSSSDKSIAEVNQYGKVTAVKEGTATITVRTNDGGKIGTCVVTVWSDMYDPIIAPPESRSGLPGKGGNLGDASRGTKASKKVWYLNLPMSKSKVKIKKAKTSRVWKKKDRYYNNTNIALKYKVKLQKKHKMKGVVVWVSPSKNFNTSVRGYIRTKKKFVEPNAKMVKGKTYYVKMMVITTKDGKEYRSGWSKVKKIKGKSIV